MVWDLTRRFGGAFWWGNKDGLRPSACFTLLPREVFYLSSNHFRDCPIALELLELYWNGFDHIFLIVHSLCRLMVRALLLMFLSLVYRRDPFLARCYIQCTHPLLARLLDVIKCSITFMLMTLSYILRSGRRLFLI